MREALLHYLWQRQSFSANALQTVSGLPLLIHEVGTHNEDAGPDFLSARIQIGKTSWSGQLEIHIRASDWYRHGHQDDPAYDAVVLHVVWEADKAVFRRDGSQIPCLRLADYVNAEQVRLYERLAAEADWIPCARLLPDACFDLKSWTIDLLAERLITKSVRLQERWLQLGKDWEQLFYEELAGGFGLRVNADAMRQLAGRTARKTLLKHRSQPHQMEALLLGQAGLLDTLTAPDDYCRQLQREYRHLKRLYQLQPASATIWKYSRLRPAAFPDIRIAMLAQLLRQTQHLWSKVCSGASAAAMTNAFQVRITGYWQQHSRLGVACGHRSRQLGEQAINLILINVVAPMLYFHAKSRNDPSPELAAARFLSQIPAEDNKLIRNWKKLGIHPRQAADSQALLQLKKTYCTNKRCHRCRVGRELLGLEAWEQKQ